VNKTPSKRKKVTQTKEKEKNQIRTKEKRKYENPNKHIKFKFSNASDFIYQVASLHCRELFGLHEPVTGSNPNRACLSGNAACGLRT
jgi:hypothetical protein